MRRAFSTWPLISGAARPGRLVHPEIPFRLRHLDLRLREIALVILGLDAVDMVGMEMRDQDDIDLLRRNAGGGEIGVKRAGGSRDLPAGAGVDQHKLQPVLTSGAVKGIGSLSVAGRKASVIALRTSAGLALRTNLSSIGRSQTPSLSAVSS